MVSIEGTPRGKRLVTVTGEHTTISNSKNSGRRIDNNSNSNCNSIDNNSNCNCSSINNNSNSTLTNYGS